MLGAFIAARFAINWGANFVRYVLLIVIFGASMKLFGIIDYILGYL